MTDRRILIDDGMITIAISVDSRTNKLLVPPIFYTQGVIEKKKGTEEVRMLVEKAIREKLETKTSFAELKNVIKLTAGDYLESTTGRRPMIIPVIMSKN